MALETFAKAKDAALYGLLIFIAGIAWDVKKTVSKLSDDNLIYSIRIQTIQNDIEDGKNKDKEQDEDIVEIKAILNRDDYQYVYKGESKKRK